MTQTCLSIKSPYQLLHEIQSCLPSSYTFLGPRYSFWQLLPEQPLLPFPLLGLLHHGPSFSFLKIAPHSCPPHCSLGLPKKVTSLLPVSLPVLINEQAQRMVSGEGWVGSSLLQVWENLTNLVTMLNLSLINPVEQTMSPFYKCRSQGPQEPPSWKQKQGVPWS